MKKKCTGCGILKPITDFYKRRASADGLAYKCKPCHIKRNREYREKNREKQREYRRGWYRETREQQRKYHREYYRKNNKHLNERKRRWRRNNPERERKHHQKWRRNNPGKVHEAWMRRRARKLNARGSHTEREWQELLKHYDYKCLCCGSTESLSRDHVVPLSKGGSDDIANIQVLCLHCNQIKGTDKTDYRNNPLPKHWRQIELLDD